ncbi:MAG: histidine phosphatase family protein [Candidatus Gracilibacteria bacterium]|nr:histidine phosphatase family protein [Candidatus Gracilibacteria bacterium]
MNDYNFSIYRHAHYDRSTGSLTENGRLKSIEKGKDLSQLIERVNDNVQIITSTSQRAIETAELLANGLGYSGRILKIGSLKEEGVVLDAVKEINQLVLSRFNVIISHGPNISTLSKYLGYEGKTSNSYNFLEGHIFNVNNEKLKMNLKMLEHKLDLFDIAILRVLMEGNHSIHSLSSELACDVNQVSYRLNGKLLKLGLIEESSGIFKICI